MLLSKVTSAIERHEMLRPGERVLVGLSGGADSVALTEALLELRPKLGLSLVLAHLNHGLRPEAIEDEEFCRRFARERSLPFTSERIDVAARARAHRRSMEDEGRRSRYRFLHSQAERFRCAKIAVGHTLDDQAETFLLRLFRGSGGRGLGSVHPVVPVMEVRIVRPLLEVRRSEIEAFLEGRGIPYREDSTNNDPRFTRNRIRHVDLPRLSSAYNPRLAETLARTASLLRDEEDWMQASTLEAYRSLAEEASQGVRLSLLELGGKPRALQRRLVRLALERLRGSLSGVGHIHVEEVLSLAEHGQSGRELHLPGVVVLRSFKELLFRRREPFAGREAVERGYNGFEYRLKIPARIRIPEGGGTLVARISSPGGKPDPEMRRVSREVPSPPFGPRVIVGFEGELPELKVRSPRSGDRFHPLGAPGSKPLTRYLMERKIARHARSRVPLLVRGADGARNERGSREEEILWVIGHGVAESSRVSGASGRLRLEWVAS